MFEYLPCPRCGSRILNKLQHYNLCACQIPSMIKEEPISEREARWLKTVRSCYKYGRDEEGRAILEAILLEHPTSQEAQEMLWRYEK